MRMRKTLIAVGTSVATIATLAACGPGGSSATSTNSAAASSGPVSTDAASMGNITLTVWDQNQSGTQNQMQVALNNAFMKKYPNIKIVRNTQSFSDLKTSLKLALQQKNPPDVVQANQGYPDMGTFVSSNLIIPLNKYADAYGWNTYFPSALLNYNKFTADGKKFQQGNLYGISQTGEMVGVYYNKSDLAKLGVQPPATMSDLEADMAKAKAAGMMPMQWGDNDQSDGIHLFGTIQNTLVPKTTIRDLITSQNNETWTNSGTLAAAQKLADWQKAGYIPSGAMGITNDQAAVAFSKGQGVFMITGTWELGTIQDGLGTNAAFTALQGYQTTNLVTMGGEGLAWAITTGSKHPDAAAAYMNFINAAPSAQIVANSGNLPAVAPTGWNPAADSLMGTVKATWDKISSEDGLTPYLDYSTPTFYSTITAGVQNLIGGKITPQAFTEALQKDYSAFQASNK